MPENLVCAGLAILDNATWLTAADGSAVSGTRVIADGIYSTTVTGTFTANAWDDSQSGYFVSEFGAFGISDPITADYQFSNVVENLTFDFQHVNSSGTTYDDMFVIYAYDENGDLLDPADVVAGLTGLVDETVIINPDGSVTLEADGTTANNVTLALPGQISQLTIVFDNGPDGTFSGGAGIGDLSFNVVPPDDIVEGSAGADIIDSAYVGDPEGDRIDANDSTGAQTGNPGSNDDYVLAMGGDDSVRSGAGSDTVFGGTGSDTLRGQGGADELHGEDGNDQLFGGAGTDTLFGGVGNDTLNGGTGADSVDGGSGDDVFRLSGTFGNDTIVGGETGETGGDTLNLEGLTTPTTIDLTANDPEAGSVTSGSSTASFSEIENIELGTARETIVLGDGSGSDTVTGFDVTNSGDGTANDQLNVSGLTSDGGTTPVDAWDVVVTDTNGDGTGDAILTFPGGESITLVGVTPDQVDSAPELFAIGVPCFTPGTMIETAAGEVPVETIRPGDLVRTADAGFQPVRWIGARTLTARDLHDAPDMRPVILRKGAFGNRRKMRVSPQHGMILKTDDGERLIRAKHAAEYLGGKVARVEKSCEHVTYIHIMFDDHQIIFAEGAATEAFYPGPVALGGLDLAARSELLFLFPELAGMVAGSAGVVDAYGHPARAYLKRRDLRTMAQKGVRGAAVDRV